VTSFEFVGLERIPQPTATAERNAAAGVEGSIFADVEDKVTSLQTIFFKFKFYKKKISKTQASL
jgi:hypothetical protein